MLVSRFFKALALSCLAAQAAGLALPLQSRQALKQNGQQSIVEWDQHSIFVDGERVLLLSGEFHPYRLPVAGLWLDVFQKVKALGFNCVSFYVDWNLLEGKQGHYLSDGVFDYKPFFDAAKQAGIYLIARPGPYINAEVSAGGFPGWMQRFSGKLRTPAPDYMNATTEYINQIGATIADAQITNGGPVILLQPENEYTIGSPGTEFPNPTYFQEVEDQYRSAGIVVPFISNDASPNGNFAPGTGQGAVDVYGHDGYPLGFDCSNPSNWPDNNLPGNWLSDHQTEAPNTPYSIDEFQGGSFDPWGGVGLEKCAAFINEEFERVFNKNNYAVGVTIYNLYMMYGGTNWGNLGHPEGYTSYDYGAAIKEDRTIMREKYSELKLEANFLQASPAYLTANAQYGSAGTYTDTSDITVTPLFGNTSFWVIRHSAYNTEASVNYKLKLPTSAGNLTIPQLNGSLSLNGRDSKICVTDYDLGGLNLLYSSAEIFTWKKYDDKTVLVLYGGPGEQHEAAFITSSTAKYIQGGDVSIVSRNGSVILNWQTTSGGTVVQFDNGLMVYVLDRNSAYNYWVLNLPGAGSPPSNYSTASSVIVKAGYLLRSANVQGSTLQLAGDVNATTAFEVIGAPSNVKSVSFNGKDINCQVNKVGALAGTVNYSSPKLNIPALSSLQWKYVDSLPELSSTYDDSLWTVANVNSTQMNGGVLSTPSSLFAGDYGYNTGNLLFRGHFTATGNETTFTINTQGGDAFGASVWLNGTLLGSWSGSPSSPNKSQPFNLPKLTAGAAGTITVLIDHMGLDENYDVGADGMKAPRGILDYDLAGRAKTEVSWRLTGNLGGETYADLARGPLNEGGLYAERQGWHLPSPPTQPFKAGKPTDGISSAGVAFYTTSFDLDLPQGYDIPLSLVYTNATGAASNFRSQIYVNGYQFGRYVNNLGPQTSYPVPEGILNYHGTNYIAVSLWALDPTGAKIGDLNLVAGPAVQSGYGSIGLSPMPAWQKRTGAY